MTIFYFTATGNCLAAAKRIAKETNAELISIPQIINNENLQYKDDAIGIIFPIYCFNMPFMLRDFINKVQLEADYLFVVATYGSIPGGAVASLQKQAGKRGYHFHYTNQVILLDTYLPFYEMDKEIEKLSKRDFPKHMDIIVNDIVNRKQSNLKTHLGKKIITSIGKPVFQPQKSARKYIVNESCNKCGICAQVCPVSNITITDKLVFDKNCEGCLSCLHLCPKNALHLKSERSGKRWINPEVSVKEIIEANNRKQV